MYAEYPGCRPLKLVAGQYWVHLRYQEIRITTPEGAVQSLLVQGAGEAERSAIASFPHPLQARVYGGFLLAGDQCPCMLVDTSPSLPLYIGLRNVEVDAQFLLPGAAPLGLPPAANGATLLEPQSILPSSAAFTFEHDDLARLTPQQREAVGLAQWLPEGRGAKPRFSTRFTTKPQRTGAAQAASAGLGFLYNLRPGQEEAAWHVEAAGPGRAAPGQAATSVSAQAQQGRLANFVPA